MEDEFLGSLGFGAAAWVGSVGEEGAMTNYAMDSVVPGPKGIRPRNMGWAECLVKILVK